MTDHIAVRGAFYDYLTGEEFTLMTEAAWGQFTTFSASLFWGALEGLKTWAKSIDI